MEEIKQEDEEILQEMQDEQITSKLRSYTCDKAFFA